MYVQMNVFIYDGQVVHLCRQKVNDAPVWSISHEDARP